MRERPSVVHQRGRFDHCDRNQLLPGKLLEDNRRLVQPASEALRSLHAHVHEDRNTQSRDHPREVPPNSLCEERRGQVRDQGERQLGARLGLQRRRVGRRRQRQDQGVENELDADVP